MPRRRPRPVINMVNINNGGVIKENLFKIMGSVTATANFQDYRIEWGEGNDLGVASALRLPFQPSGDTPRAV